MNGQNQFFLATSVPSIATFKGNNVGIVDYIDTEAVLAAGVSTMSEGHYC